MGGTGFSLRLKRLPGTSDSAQELYDALYSVIEANVRRVAKGKAYAQVTDDYLEIAREDGAGRDTEIDFGFRDGAGLCQASTHACNHWFSLLLSALAVSKKKGEPSPLEVMAGHFGFAIAKPPAPLKELLATCEEPLVVVRGHLFGTGTHRKKIYLVSDELDDGMLELESLTPKERAAVESAVRKQRCDCRVCEALRDRAFALKLPKSAHPAPKGKSSAKGTPKKPAVKVKSWLTSDRLHRGIQDGCKTLPDAVFAPAKLESMRIDAPISDLPEAILKLKSLRRLSLAITKITRVPAVLQRIPSLRELYFYLGALDGLGELASLPELTSLSFDRVSGVSERLEELPFASLTKLETLQLRDLGLTSLPAGIGQLGALTTLDLWSNRIATLPTTGLERLRALNLCRNELTDAPHGLARLTALTKLELSGNALAQLPSELARLTALTRLEVSQNPLTDLPDWLPSLPLEELHVDEVAFRELPRVLGRMASLRELWCCGPSLVAAPDGSLPPRVRYLTFGNSPALRTLPDSIRDLTELEILVVGRCPELVLPAAMRALPELTSLAVWRCDAIATAPPAWIAELPSLVSLDFSTAPLAEIPPWIRGMKLTHLHLDGTQVASVPEWITELPLEALVLSNTKIPRAEVARLKKLLPNVYFG